MRPKFNPREKVQIHTKDIQAYSFSSGFKQPKLEFFPPLHMIIQGSMQTSIYTYRTAPINASLSYLSVLLLFSILPLLLLLIILYPLEYNFAVFFSYQYVRKKKTKYIVLTDWSEHSHSNEPNEVKKRKRRRRRIRSTLCLVLFKLKVNKIILQQCCCCVCVCVCMMSMCVHVGRDHFSMVHRFMLIVCERISCGFSMHTQSVCCSNVNSFIGSFSLPRSLSFVCSFQFLFTKK